MPCSFQIANPVGRSGEFYNVGSGYGWRTINGENQFHLGIDIPAPQFTLVRSVLDGVVLRNRVGERAGNYVVIKHPNGYETKYMHLFNSLVADGDTVRAGDIIGTVGQTGSATGPHLHFELLDPEGKHVDPTDCYNNSIHVVPYEYPQETPPEDLPGSGKKKKWIPWAVGGGLLVMTVTGIIYFTREERQNA